MKKRKEMYLKESAKLILLKIIWFISFLCVVNLASAQTPTVKGVVKDAQGRTLSGVTVKIKGTQKVTLTDENGRFSLNAPSKETILSFSFIGMEPKELTVGNRTSLDITLEDAASGLNEVVVVGYGAQKKIAVTGAVTSVGSKELLKSSSPNLSSAMAGKLTGLSVLQNGGGQPGVDYSTLYLRGQSTLNGTDPLILIDGVTRSDMNNLNVNEVESISILKDASATAVFGVRGANGVILITTKRGTEGKPLLNINLTQSYTSFTREPNRVHSWDYMTLRNQALTNDGLPALYSDATIEKYKNPLKALDPTTSDYAEQASIRNYMYCDHDWYREMIKEYTPQTNASVDLSGGTKQLSYFINAGFVHQGGNLNVAKNLSYNPAAEMNRYTFRTNLDYKFTKSLTAYLNLGSYIQIQNMPLSGTMYGNSESWMMRDLIYQTTSILPITPGPLTIAGFGVPAGKIVDPGYLDRAAYEIMNGRGQEQNTLSNLNSTLGVKLDLSQAVTPGLSIKGEVSYDSYGGTTYQKAITSELYTCNVDYDANSFSYAAKRVPGSNLSISTEGTSTHYRVNLQGSINYDRSFGKHKVGAMIVGQRDFWDISSGTSTALIPYNILGIAGRATYDYDSRYFAEFDMGYNGSEQFAPKNRFGFFPAGSAGWVLSNEDFLKGNNTLTNLKLRASYGKVGNDQIGSSRFLYLDNNTVATGGYVSGLDNGYQVSMGLVGNSSLHWEIAHKLNLGLDFGLFKNLKGSLDYFNEHRTDILITRSTVPNFQGVASTNIPKANMGIVDNHGYEAELSYYLPVNKNLSFNFKGNYSFARNVVKYADEVKNDSTYSMRYGTTGYRIDQCVGYKIDWGKNGGYFVSADDIANSGLTYEIGTPRVGDFRYIDENGDGKINSKDEVPIGYSKDVPEITYGFTFGANYKSFDCSVGFQGVSHYSMNYSGQNVYENVCSGTYYDYQLNSWTEERYEKGEKITYPALSTVQTTNHVANDFFIMDRSFLRLKNVEIGYTLANQLKAIGISKLRVFVGGQNLYVWDNMRTKHLDPEQDDPIGYPVTKMWNLGVNVTF